MGVNKRLNEKYENQPMRAAAPPKAAAQPVAQPAVKPDAKTPPNPAEKKGDGAGRGRKSPYLGKRMYRKVKENPYRKDSIREKSWNLIKDGMLYEDFIKAGGDAGAVKFGVVKEHIEMKEKK